MKEIITMEVIKITTMGSFDPLIQLVTPFAEDALLFFQTMAVLFATAMGVYYKLRQTLYLIFDYPYKYYTFKLFEV